MNENDPHYNGSERVAAMAAMEADIRSIKGELGEIKDRLKKVGQTDWSVLASWAAVIIAFLTVLVGGVGSGHVRNLNALDSKITASGGLSDIAVTLVERTANHDTRINQLDTDLQREMRDLDTALLAAIEEIKVRLTSLELGDTESLSIRSALLADVRALERQVYGADSDLREN